MSFVYFIRDDHSQRIKIGISAKPAVRLCKMQSDCPGDLRLLSVIEGGAVVEGALHKRFEAARVRGEWFAETPELAAFIASLPPYERPAGKRRRKEANETALGRWLNDSGMTDRDFGAAVGVTRIYIWRLRHGQRRPSLGVAVKIAKATGLPIEALAEAA